MTHLAERLRFAAKRIQILSKHRFLQAKRCRSTSFGCCSVLFALLDEAVLRSTGKFLLLSLIFAGRLRCGCRILLAFLSDSSTALNASFEFLRSMGDRRSKWLPPIVVKANDARARPAWPFDSGKGAL